MWAEHTPSELHRCASQVISLIFCYILLRDKIRCAGSALYDFEAKKCQNYLHSMHVVFLVITVKSSSQHSNKITTNLFHKVSGLTVKKKVKCQKL